jgi:hypothetical protein
VSNIIAGTKGEIERRMEQGWKKYLASLLLVPRFRFVFSLLLPWLCVFIAEDIGGTREGVGGGAEACVRR